MWIRPLACVAFVLAGAWPVCAEQTSDRAVGLSFASYADAKRSAWDSNGPRPLAATLWYPVPPGTAMQEWPTAFLLSGPHAMRAPLPNAPDKFPLVLLSHGTGGSAATLAWFARGLAQAGYIVAAVNHHGNTATEQYLPQGFVLWWERARDLSVLLDQVAGHPMLGARIDMRRVGVAGFSLGGYTALALAGARTDHAQWQRHCAAAPADRGCKLPPEARFDMNDVMRVLASDERARASLARAADDYRDERVRAAFVMAPALAQAFDRGSLVRIAIPVSMVVGDNDDQAPAKTNAAWMAAQMQHAKLHQIRNGTHYMFIAQCTPSGQAQQRQICTDPSGLGRAQVHRDTVAQAVAFFDAALSP